MTNDPILDAVILAAGSTAALGVIYPVALGIGRWIDERWPGPRAGIRAARALPRIPERAEIGTDRRRDTSMAYARAARHYHRAAETVHADRRAAHLDRAARGARGHA